MKDYSVLNGMIENQKSELRTAYDKGYNQGVKDFDLILATSKKEEEGYNRGVNDLWESVCKFMDADIVSDKEIWGCTSWEKFAQLSPSEVIARLKEYDEKQNCIERCCKNCKHSENGMVGNSKRCEVCYYDEVLKANKLFEPMETDNSKIEVGDEIVYSDPLKGEEKGIAMGICNNWVEVKFLKSWNCVGVHKDSVKKTGRHFEQLDEILETMKNE